MNSSRDRILSRLSKGQNSRVYSAMPRHTTPHNAKPHNTKPKEHRLKNNLDDSDLAAFVKQLEDNQIQVRQSTQDSWPDTLCALAQEKQLNHWVVGTEKADLLQASTALKNAAHRISVFEHQYEDLKSMLFNDIDASFTLAEAAIAETGTLLLIPSKQEPRTLSLIPPTHVVLLKRSQILKTMEQALSTFSLDPDQHRPTNILLISSPSKTADIQQTLAYGAHGPKELIVILID